MARLPVVQEPNRVLRKKAREVGLAEIKSKKIQRLVRDMSDTLRAIEVGIGLAAPQVGRSLRIFVISEEALLTKPREKLDLEELKKNKREKKWKQFVFINPQITRTSKRKNLLVEGCLSVSDPEGKLVYGQIERFDKLKVEALDQEGRKFVRGAAGLFAQVIQHELDHLNGILFVDNAEEIKKIEVETGNEPPPDGS